MENYIKIMNVNQFYNKFNRKQKDKSLNLDLNYQMLCQ